MHRHRHIYEKVRHVVTEPEWTLAVPLIEEILKLKSELGAVVLAHNYQSALIYHGIADITGDSLELARRGREVEEDVLVVCGVNFMAETAKLLNPERTVLHPAPEAGCTLADAVVADDVRRLRRAYPGVPVVTYVNTSVEVKAEADVCCTSSNAVEVVEHLVKVEGAERVIFLPDRHLAGYVASQTAVEIISWPGSCIVHEAFRLSDLEALRAQYPGIRIIAHPECPVEIQEAADMVGSTRGLIDYVARERPSKVAMITECTMSANVASHHPDVEFIQPCSLCPFMKMVTLESVRDSLRHQRHRVEIDSIVAQRARRAIERMLEI
jgi:quinolinate synthase